jgi:DNA-binding PadR family transcriptional regulator
MDDPRITVPVLKVLQYLLARGSGERVYGREIAQAVGLKSGTLYPVLARLEGAGWLTSAWEDVSPREAGRPRRRYYQLTGTGQQTARHALADIGMFAGPPARPGRGRTVLGRPALGGA